MSLRTVMRRKRLLRKAERPDAVPLNLVSMIDVFTTLVFFLLLTSTNVQTLRSPRSLELPQSASIQTPNDTPVLMVTPDNILWQGQSIMQVKVAEAQPSLVLEALKAQLMQTPLVQMQGDASGTQTRGEINILADKDIPYACGEAQFARISLSVNHRSGLGAKP
jgi:biopolymer transport protein TolR